MRRAARSLGLLVVVVVIACGPVGGRAGGRGRGDGVGAGAGDSATPAACGRLGWAYERGEGVPRDEGRAATLYARACEGGDAWACNQLAFLYDGGRGVPEDPARAAALHRRACEAGLARACSNLGFLHEKGRGAPADAAAAARWYERAAAAGDAEGAYNLANLLVAGRGVEVDEPRAAALYEASCEAGLADACANLAWMIDNGVGVRIEPARAAALHERACAGGVEASCRRASAAAETAAPRPEGEWAWDRFEGACAPPELVRIPGGTFEMGERGSGDASRSRRVTVSPYRLMTTEVTVCQYRACVRAGACTPPRATTMWRGREAMLPVTGVEWAQAEAYCGWRGWRLPTEAEWEFAARGQDGRPYPWGSDPPDCARADWNGAACGDGPSVVATRPAGASPFGVHDLTGNVKEWVADWYGAYPEGPAADPVGPARGASRVIRGGAWHVTDPAWLTATARYRWAPMNSGDATGFRCAGTVSGNQDSGRDPAGNPNFLRPSPRSGGRGASRASGAPVWGWGRTRREAWSQWPTTGGASATAMP